MFKEGITGITLAELTLILLIVTLFVFFVSGYTSQEKFKNLEKEYNLKMKSHEVGEYTFQEKFKNLEKEYNLKMKSHETKISNYKKAMAREGLKSRIKPSCKEIGLADDYLTTIIIMGKNKFKILDKIYTYDQLISLYSDELQDARKFDCRHSIKASFIKGLSAEEYNIGLLSLRRLFYTNILGGQ